MPRPSRRVPLTLVMISAAVLGGCHTLEGAGTGAMYSLYLLSASNSPPSSCGGNDAAAVFVVAVLGTGAVIGAAVGVVEDLKELCIYIERQWNQCGSP